MRITPELDRFARRHNGLITMDAWTTGGGSRRGFYRAAEHGLLTSLAPGVAALAGVTVGPVQRIGAWVLSRPGRVVASHRSAALLWGGPVVGDRPVDLLTVDRNLRIERAGVVLHRPVDARATEAVSRSGIDSVSPIRVLLDLGAVAPDAVAPCLESFLVSGWVSGRTVATALGQHRRKGRAGVAALAGALADVTATSKPPDSALESVVARLLHGNGLAGWVFHARPAGFEVDFAFSAERVVLEVDGFAFHGRREAFERDRERDATLAASGWLVVRATWRQITREPSGVLERLRATLAARS